MEPWLEDFLASERTWLEEATERGVPRELVSFATKLLDRLVSAHRDAPMRLYSVTEAAAMTGRAPETIRRRARKGSVGRRKTPAGNIQLTIEDVVALGRSPGRRARTLSAEDFTP